MHSIAATWPWPRSLPCKCRFPILRHWRKGRRNVTTSHGAHENWRTAGCSRFGSQKSILGRVRLPTPDGLRRSMVLKSKVFVSRLNQALITPGTNFRMLKVEAVANQILVLTGNKQTFHLEANCRFNLPPLCPEARLREFSEPPRARYRCKAAHKVRQPTCRREAWALMVIPKPTWRGRQLL